MQLALIVLSLLLAGCVATSVQEAAPAQEVEPIVETGERLIASPPADWQRVSQVNNQTLRLSDFIPPNEEPSSWTTKLSFESHKAEEISIDPLDLLKIDTASAQKNCKATQQFNIYAGYENNYESAVQLLLCTENINREMGEIALIKAIRGNDHYYVIRLIRRIPAFNPGEHQLEDEEIATWSSFISRIYVCDDSESHPCHPSSGR